MIHEQVPEGVPPGPGRGSQTACGLLALHPGRGAEKNESKDMKPLLMFSGVCGLNTAVVMVTVLSRCGPVFCGGQSQQPSRRAPVHTGLYPWFPFNPSDFLGTLMTPDLGHPAPS